MKKFTVLLICVLASFAQLWSQNYAKVWLDKFHFTRGEDIVTHYTGGFGFPKDNMNIAPLGQTITGIPGHYSTTWCYFDNPGAKEGTATIPGGNMGNAADGYYWIVYLIDDGYEQGSEYIPCYYGDTPPQNESPVLALEERTAEYTTITFTDSELWRMLIKEINVDGTALSTDDYSLEAGALYILKDLTTAKSIKITAWDHPDASIQLDPSSIQNESIAQNVCFSNNCLQVINDDALIQSVSIISLAGVTIESYQVIAGNNQYDLNHLNAGIYFAKVCSKNIKKVIKIVIGR